MKTKGVANFYLVIMAVMLGFIIYSLTMERLASKIIPLIVGSAVFIMSGIGWVRETLVRYKTKDTAGDGKGKDGKSGLAGWRIYLLNIAWLAGGGVGVYLVGLTLAIALFVLFYMRWLGARWRIGIIAAILVPAFIYVVFELAMQIELYRGLLFSLLGY